MKKIIIPCLSIFHRIRWNLAVCLCLLTIGGHALAAPPAVSSIVRASANPTDTGVSVVWTVTFSKAVTGVGAADFALVSSYAVSGASITSVTGSGTTWAVTANTGNGAGSGNLGLNLVDDDTIVDSGGGRLGGTGAGNGNFTGQVYMVSPPCSQPANTPAGLTLTCVCDNFNRASLNPSPIFSANWLATISSASDTTGIVPNITNQGYLRLTNNTTYNGKAATAPGAYPAAGNYISVEFRLFAYNGSNADGIAVTLSDYSVSPVPGSSGGSLGYAQKTGINGFAGGWIGVGIDEYGNYQNPTEGRFKGPGARAQSVAVRGSGSGTTGYAWLGGTTANLSPLLSSASATTPAPGHRYQVIVDARSEPASTGVSVNRDTDSGSGYASLVSLGNVYSAAIAQATTQAAVPSNWQISFTGSTGASTNIHEIAAVRICASNIYPPGGGTASGFNAIDEAYGASPAVQNFVNGNIYMKVVGKPFKLNVAALHNSQIQTGYVLSGSKDVFVKLVNKGNISDSDYCEIDSSKANYCSTNCTSKTAVPGGESQTLTFTPSDAGKKQTGNYTLNAAYNNLVAIVSDSATKACSTDAFSVRPLSFSPVTITATNAGQAVFKAGNDPFTITATTNVGGYTGVPKVNSAALSAVSPATIAGTISGTFSAATSGASSSTAVGTMFQYSEVGNFKLPGYDPATDTASARGVYDGVLPADCTDQAVCNGRKLSTWTGVDSISTKRDCIDGSYSNVINATGNYANNVNYGKYGCLFGTTGDSSFGRFTPDHFALLEDFTPGIENQSSVEAACGGATGFTYMSQPFKKLKFQLEAQNGTNGKTLNYTGVLATATAMVVAEDGDNGTSLTSRMTGIPTGIWTGGSYSVDTATANFMRLQTSGQELTPDGPYDSLQLGINVVDADGIMMGGMNMNPATAGACGATCDSRRLNDTAGAVAQPTKVRFGRLKLSNAHGSDKLDLPVPMRAEYWNGTTGMFVTNVLDSCTQISCANVALLNYKGGVNSGNVSTANAMVGSTCATPETLTSGVGRLKLKKPAGVLASKGSVEVCVDLGTDTPEVCRASSASLPWLQGKWRSGDPEYNDDPWGRATFGVYKNANEFIYFREMY